MYKLDIGAIIAKRSKNTRWVRNQPLEKTSWVIVGKHCANQLVATTIPTCPLMVTSEDLEAAEIDEFNYYLNNPSWSYWNQIVFMDPNNKLEDQDISRNCFSGPPFYCFVFQLKFASVCNQPQLSHHRSCFVMFYGSTFESCPLERQSLQNGFKQRFTNIFVGPPPKKKPEYPRSEGLENCDPSARPKGSHRRKHSH